MFFCSLTANTSFIGKDHIAATFSEPLFDMSRSFARGYNAAFLHVLFGDEPTMIEWLLNN